MINDLGVYVNLAPLLAFKPSYEDCLSASLEVANPRLGILKVAEFVGVVITCKPIATHVDS